MRSFIEAILFDTRAHGLQGEGEMYAASVEPGRVTLVLSINEVRLLNNALNELVNGVAVAAASFETRLGGTRDEVAHLLMSVHAILDSAEVVQPKNP